MDNLLTTIIPIIIVVFGFLFTKNRIKSNERQRIKNEMNNDLLRKGKVREEIDSDIDTTNAANELRENWSTKQ